MAYETFLDREPVFTGLDLAAYLEGRGVDRPQMKARRVRERWQSTGRVVTVAPDVFAVVTDGLPAEGFQPWPYLVAAKLAPDAVLTHRSAVDFWGHSYTFWYEVVYSATDPAPRVSYGRMRYLGVRFPDRLIASGTQLTEVVEEDYVGGKVRVSTMERTLVDLMAASRYGGGWVEIWRTLALVESFDLAAVAAYCDLLAADAELRAKVGFFLDHHRDEWDITDGELEPFRPPAAARRELFYLSPGSTRPCVVAAGWNLVVPVGIWEREWEWFH